MVVQYRCFGWHWCNDYYCKNSFESLYLQICTRSFVVFARLVVSSHLLWKTGRIYFLLHIFHYSLYSYLQGARVGKIVVRIWMFLNFFSRSHIVPVQSVLFITMHGACLMIWMTHIWIKTNQKESIWKTFHLSRMSWETFVPNKKKKNKNPTSLLSSFFIFITHFSWWELFQHFSSSPYFQSSHFINSIQHL